MKKVSIILVNRDNNGQPIDYSDLFRDSVTTFGGYTLTDQVGGYLSENGTLMYDKSKKLDLCFLATDYNEKKRSVIESFLNRLFVTAAQEMVFVEWCNQTAIISENDISDFLEIISSDILVK